VRGLQKGSAILYGNVTVVLCMDKSTNHVYTVEDH
jgi:hypothetical protein